MIIIIIIIMIIMITITISKLGINYFITVLLQILREI